MRNPFLPCRLKMVATFCAVALLAIPGNSSARKKKDKNVAEGVIAGVVLNKAGEPLAGTRVSVVGTGDARFMETANKKGEFEIRIPEATGSYLIRLESDGYGGFETTLQLEAGDRQDLRFELIEAQLMRKNDAVVAYNAGVKAFGEEDFATAEAKFREALEMDGELAPPHLGLADIYLRTERYAEAAPAIEKFLELQPQELQAQQLAYEIYRKLGDEAKAAAALTALKGSDLAANLAVRVYNEGVVATHERNDALAIARFRAAIELDPSLAAAYAALATTHYNRQEYTAAATLVDSLLGLEPQHVQGRRVRYLIHDAQGNLEAAAAALDSYLEVDADGAADLLYQRADLDFRDGEVERAREALTKVLELSPDMARAHYTMGLVYVSSDAAKARQHLGKFLELAPDDPEAAMARQILEQL